MGFIFQSDAGWEEYYDYIFPDDEANQPNFKLLQMARMWKQANPEDTDDDSDSDNNDNNDNNDENTQEQPTKVISNDNENDDKDNPDKDVDISSDSSTSSEEDWSTVENTRVLVYAEWTYVGSQNGFFWNGS